MSEEANKAPEEFPDDEYNHIHMWEILDVKYPKAQSPHPRAQPPDITWALIRCVTCNLPQTIELDGRWLLQDLVRKHNDE